MDDARERKRGRACFCHRSLQRGRQAQRETTARRPASSIAFRASRRLLARSSETDLRMQGSASRSPSTGDSRQEPERGADPNVRVVVRSGAAAVFVCPASVRMWTIVRHRYDGSWRGISIRRSQGCLRVPGRASGTRHRRRGPVGGDFQGDRHCGSRRVSAHASIVVPEDQGTAPAPPSRHAAISAS